jgi:outer membrane immunogenic protein
MDMRINYSAKIRLATIFLSSVALPILPAFADASLEELQARLERAQKENVTLKTEKLERENLTMKAEKLEEENAKLRSEANSKSVAPVASHTTPTKQSETSYSDKHQKTSSVEQTQTTSYPDADHVKRTQASSYGDIEDHKAAKIHANRVVNDALTAIPKNDDRRDMRASANNVSLSPIVRQWQGIYIGVNVAYGGGGINRSTDSVINYGILGAGTSNDTIQVGGPLVGVQFGYNHQFANKLLVGAESDIDWADVYHYAGKANSASYFAYGSSGGLNNNYSRTGLDWQGSTRLRIGYASGNFLPYVSGGIAYGGLSSTTQQSNYIAFAPFYSGGSVSSGSNQTVQFGWAAGAGAEYMLADALSIRGEYLYTALGGISRADQTVISNNAGTASGNVTTGTFGIHQIRFGLNYHTGWLGSTQAVTSKY